MIDIQIQDETSPLKSVVLGIAESLGIPDYEMAYDPKSKEHIRAGTYPHEEDLKPEMNSFLGVLEKHGVTVFRPNSIEHYNQVFARDIGFVIDKTFVRSKMLAPREHEIEGIEYLISKINPDQVIEAAHGVRMEGGDVMPCDDMIFVGYSKKPDFQKYIVSRTNEQGVSFIQELFPKRQIKSFELKKSDTNPRDNALHLDCCFQPIGKKDAIIYKDGFKNEEDYLFLVDYFGAENIIEINREEMYNMNSNIFSINPQTIVSDKSFVRLNEELKRRGYQVEEIPYMETAKMEGLLRCSTLPLYRE